MLVIFAVVSLAFAAGLNGLITVTLVAVMARGGATGGGTGVGWPLVVSDRILFGVLVPLTLLDIWMSKIPRVARVHDILQAAWRPIAAGALAVAVTRTGPNDYMLIAIGPMAIALFVHVMRIAVVRPVVGSATHGIGIPLMSMTEDLIAAVIAIVAIRLPEASLAFTALCGYLLWRAYKKLRRRHEMRMINAAGEATEVRAEAIEEKQPS